MADKNEELINSDAHPVDVLDASYSLLAILREKCPGTNAHGANVASLLEALGSELGLHIQHLKIAGRYHDVGKIKHPKYYSENQTEEDGNPHDDIAPHISHKIITSHIGETAEILLNDPNIPIEVIKWCIQHHGTSVLRYFFVKSETKNENNYRYQGTLPSTLEAGLLMICDCLEAKCRSMYQADKLKDIEEVVHTTIEQLIDDKQLDNVELPKLSYLRTIKEILVRELSSMYKAKRIDYDEAKEEASNGKS